MASSYPGSVDSFATATGGALRSTNPSLSTRLNDHSDAIVALQEYAVQAVNGGRERIVNESPNTTLSVDLSDGNIVVVELNANLTLTFPNVTSGRCVSFMIIFVQDSPSRTVTFPASVKWFTGGAPTITAGAGNRTWCAFMTVDNGLTWAGSYIGSTAA